MDNSRLIKTAEFGTVKGKSKVGRSRRKYRNDLTDWSGVSFSTLTKIAKDRSEWKKKTNVTVGTYRQHSA